MNIYKTLLLPLLLFAIPLSSYAVDVKEDIDFKVKRFDTCQASDTELERIASLIKKAEPREPFIIYDETDTATSMGEAEGILMDSAKPSSDYTDTNNQVTGIEEGDIIKTNGNYIYAIANTKKGNVLKIYHKSQPQTPVKTYTLPETMGNMQLFLNDGTLSVVGSYKSHYEGCGT